MVTNRAHTNTGATNGQPLQWLFYLQLQTLQYSVLFQDTQTRTIKSITFESTDQTSNTFNLIYNEVCLSNAYIIDIISTLVTVRYQ